MTANLVNHEFIGLDVQVVSSTNKSVLDMRGKVVDESMSMFYLLTNSGIKMLPKKFTRWAFSVRGQQIELDGNTIAKRPQDRVKVKS